jgi:hypothetical protein
MSDQTHPTIFPASRSVPVPRSASPVRAVGNEPEDQGREGEPSVKLVRFRERSTHC